MRKALALLTAVCSMVLSAVAQAPAPATPDVERRVASILQKMTTGEKIDLLGGINFFEVRGYPRLNLPVLETADGPVGCAMMVLRP